MNDSAESVNDSFGVAIVGCGLIGRKRAKVLSPARLVACVDVDLQQAQALAESYPGCVAATDLQVALTNPEVQIVIVSTTHQALAGICLER